MVEAVHPEVKLLMHLTRWRLGELSGIASAYYDDLTSLIAHLLSGYPDSRVPDVDAAFPVDGGHPLGLCAPR